LPLDKAAEKFLKLLRLSDTDELRQGHNIPSNPHRLFFQVKMKPVKIQIFLKLSCPPVMPSGKQNQRFPFLHVICYVLFGNPQDP